MGRGYFISFEGLDGAGKTTQIDLFERWLASQGITYVRTREPGGTPLGLEIRRLLFQQPELTITPLAEAFLFQADRAQHFETLVLPALAEGKIVVSDRCFDSSIAYQGVGQGVGTELVTRLSLIATQGHAPDLTIFLDLDPALVQERTSLSNRERHEQSRFDRASEQFHNKLRQAFLELARTYPQRIKVVDATQTPEQIHQNIIALTQTHFRAFNTNQSHFKA
ncbi:thymidylate kinase [Dictyobacter alpinus]|uniref:Thymidylate kinase n=1 Tax=Dictyobacter alpinus TaxID=2014873 RepID=A0A402B0Y6_9CHLR|nr:dTMP kinase [Dictyobacter alpinus]GCE25016.1 thymidylate kinase [Dictyobacter alpinus]